MRFVVLNIILFLTFELCAQTRNGAPECNQPPPLIRSAVNASNMICEEARRNIPRIPPQDWFQMCGLGAREGRGATANGIRDSINAIVGIADWSRRNYLLTISMAVNPGATVGFLVAQNGLQNTPASRRAVLPSPQQVRRSADAALFIMNEIGRQIDLFAANVGRIQGGMACLPWDWKMRYICMAFQQIADTAFIELVAGSRSVAEKVALIGRAFTNFQRTTRMLPELRGMPLATRINAASEALTTSNQYRNFMRLGDTSVVVRNDAITGQPRYFLEQFATVNGRRVRELQEVVRDARTGAFDANFPSGAQFARLAARNADQRFLIFADVMDLGRTNYFRAGTAAGDRYLEIVGQIMRRNMREGDLMFKNGGDELAIILNSNNPRAAMEFQNRVHADIARNPELQAMFRQNRIDRAQVLPRGQRPTPQQVAELQDASRTRPGVAFGSARIHANQGEQTWATALRRAEGQAAEVKAAAKGARGGDVSKYGQGAASPSSARPRFNAPVEVRTPLE